MTKSSISLNANQLNTYRDAVSRGRRWLVHQSDPGAPLNGPASDINWFAKLPWALAATGDRASAVAVLRTFGRTVTSQSLHSPTSIEWTNAVPYALGWLVVGARLCEEYVLARQLYAELQRYLCKKYGGARSRLDQGDDAPHHFDMAIQGAVLHAAVSVGDFGAAQRCGDLVEAWFARQPELAAGLLNLYHPQHGYSPGSESVSAMQIRFIRTATRQPWANIGFALQGLVRTSETTGVDKYAVVAYGILTHLMDVYWEDLVQHSQNHKIAHAACMLFRHTGDARCRQLSLLIAERMEQNIAPDGRALADIMFDDLSVQSDYTSIRTTCDSILWLQCICDEFGV